MPREKRGRLRGAGPPKDGSDAPTVPESGILRLNIDLGRAAGGMRGRLARYSIEAPLPAAAVVLGWKAVLAEFPSAPQRGWLSLFERAQRVGVKMRADGFSTGW